MVIRLRTATAALALGMLVALSAAPAAAGPAARKAAEPPGPKPFVVLDSMGFWRMHHEIRPPAIQVDGRLHPALVEQAWMNRQTPAAPAGWWKPDFDDGGWFRGTAHRAIKSPWLARLCMRARFEVSDPEKAKDLSLSVDFHGGIVVYVNGQELLHRHLPAARGDSPRSGELGAGALAEAYPREAFVDEANRPLFPGNVRWHNPAGGDFWKDKVLPPESIRRMGLWKRSIQDVPIPAKLLRKGVNVLAVEIVRSPYDKAVEEAKQAVPAGQKQFAYQVFFATCELERIRLTAASGEGVVSNAVRAPGLQVWNSDPAAPDFDLDFGDPYEPLRPIALTAPRNGVASGKVVVGDTKPIRGLRATAGDLRGEKGGAIPAASVRLRYGLPWDTEAVCEGLRKAPLPYPHPPTPLLCLSDAPPAEVAVTIKDYPRYDPMPVKGAVASVWATVTVPPATAPGTYSGEFTIEVTGEKPVKVPLTIKVADWLAPDPKDFTAWVDMIQSPDTLSVEYGLEVWSARHWEMIDHSLSLLGGVGNRTLYVPLIAHTNLGNEQSMVRWIRKADGTYDYDFSILERYLDSALKNMGKPEVVVCNVWDLYMLDNGGKIPEDERYIKEFGNDGRKTRQERMPQNVLAAGGKIGLGPLVTVVDPATGKTENVYLPKLTEGPSKATWAPLLKGVRDRLAKRGLGGTMMLGLNTDAWASRPIVQFFQDILPGVEWVVQSHDGFPEDGRLLHNIAKVGYQTRVWGVAFADEDKHDPWRINRVGEANQAGRLYGWKKPVRTALFERFSLNPFPFTRWRYFAEVNVTGAQRGFGRVGADLWAAVKGKDGRRSGRVHERYPESHWRNLTIRTNVLAPGVDGPAATSHFEALREGLVDCEARIFLEKALTDPALRAKLGADLAAKCQQHLDERLKLMWFSQSNLQMHAGGYDSGVQYATGWRYAPGIYGLTWYIGSPWQERNEALYTLAGEVARRLGSD